MHSHLLGEIMDIQLDRQAGRRTTACVLGIVASKYLLVVFLLGESLFVLRAFRETIIGVFLACGATWFLIDALWLFRNRAYPVWLARLFLIGWNVMALGSSWYVWSTGALSGVK
jgi:4-hydroxybenzoate polyprenyltransferase